MAPARFQRARDLFLASSDAVRDMARIRRRLDAMRASEGLRGGSLAGRAPGGVGDPMARTDARMDAETLLIGQMEEDKAVVSRLREVLYGSPEGTGGLASLRGRVMAGVVWTRYGEDLPWRSVAEAMDLTERWCQALCVQAEEVIDSYGQDRVVAGRGVAEG